MAKRGEDPQCPIWMMTFGDCMSLLVTFFVMLIAFTNIERDNLLEVLGGMKGALGLIPEDQFMDRQMEDPDVTRIGGTANAPKWLSIEELSSVIPDARMAAKRFGRPKVGSTARHIMVQMVDDGMAFVINAEFLFESGTDRLLDENDELLRQIGNYTLEFENEVRVIAVLPQNMLIKMDGMRSLSGLGIARAIRIRDAFCRLSGYGHDRFGVGMIKSVSGSGKNVKDLPEERIEIIIIGRRELKEITPEEIIVKDKWF